MFAESDSSSIYLDLIGGIAGDMFIAAFGSTYPEIEENCLRWANDIHGLPDNVHVAFSDHSADGLFGRRFTVSQEAHSDVHRHVSFQDAIDIVHATDLTVETRHAAEAIFEILARAEAAVHDVDYTAVEFHEIGGWDSVVDIILSARIITELNCDNWNCGRIPMGSGSIDFSHGLLPIPAPATLQILKGFVVSQDGCRGERVTPTGAAILKFLDPEQHNGLPPGKLIDYGTGFGSKTIDGVSNALRVYATTKEATSDSDLVAVIEFDIDDQTPEDLALGLDSIRATNGVLDLVQSSAYGKKGRLGHHIRVLGAPAHLDKILDNCFSATSTIGARWYFAQRRLLSRCSEAVEVDSFRCTVKSVTRPDGQITTKLEADDLKEQGASIGSREKLRGQVQRLTSRSDK